MKRLILICMILTLFAITTSPVLGEGQGTIRIEPHGSYYPLPIMLSSPATFNISVQPSADPTCDPHLFLVITNDTYNQLVNGMLTVTVNWTAVDFTNINVGDWNGPETENGKEVPDNVPLDTGIGYTVASLKDHLNTSDPIYWSLTSIFGPGAFLTQTPQEFTLTLPSETPRMLVYALGKIGEYDDGGSVVCPGLTAPFNNRVPPTKPGLVVPELGTILLIAAPFCALALYKYRRKR